MPPSACHSDTGVGVVVEKDGDSVAPHEPDGHGTGSEAVLPVEDESAERATEDLEALHQAPSGPAYSIFSDRQRKIIVFMVACASFFSPLSANIYFPALTALSRDLKVSNELINLSLTSYMIFQGLAPTVFGDLADMTGRRPAYVLGFIIYIGSAFHRRPHFFLLTLKPGANIGLALQNNYVALLVLRCLQSTGSSGTVALGNGVVADIASSGERGKFMGTYTFVWLPRTSLNLLRNRSIRSHGRASFSTCYWWHSDPVLRVEVAILVFDHLSNHFLDSFSCNLSRDWSERRR